MISKTVKIQKDLHARPATLLIQKTQEFPGTKVWLVKDGKKIQTNTLIGILSLGLKKDEAVIMEVDGEEETAEIFKNFIEKGMEIG
jgi:phosphotransferase system HPr (HPr) family protein